MLRGIDDGNVHTLAYAGQTAYRPRFRFQPVATLVALALALVVALPVAFVAIMWRILDVPAFWGLIAACQGGLLILLLRWTFRRSRLRSYPNALAVALVCCAVSVTLTHYGIYAYHVDKYRGRLRRAFAEENAGARNTQWQDALLDHPFATFDTFVLIPNTGKRGFLGYLVAVESASGRGQRVKGITLYAFDLLVASIIALRFGTSQAKRPYCEDCGAWFEDPRNATVLPLGYGYDLRNAIDARNPQAVLAAVKEAEGQELAGGCAVAQIYTCKGCGQSYADVILKPAGQVESPLMPPTRVTPEMIAALRAEPAREVPDEVHPPANSN
jgi:hypothetical protein